MSRLIENRKSTVGKNIFKLAHFQIKIVEALKRLKACSEPAEGLNRWSKTDSRNLKFLFTLFLYYRLKIQISIVKLIGIMSKEFEEIGYI